MPSKNRRLRIDEAEKIMKHSFFPKLLFFFLLSIILLSIIGSNVFSQSIQEVKKNPPHAASEPPQLPLEIDAPEFAEILGTKPQLVHLAQGFGFTEGPVYVSIKDKQEGYLLFTDQINDNILIIRWHGLSPYNQITPLSWGAPAIFRHPSNIADGQTLDLEGRLLTAETTGRRVSITELNGGVKTLVSFYEGKPLNSPND